MLDQASDRAWRVPALIGLACALGGCAAQTPEQPEPAPIQAADVQPPPAPDSPEDLARYCRVCVVDKGERIEEYLPSRLDTAHDGRTYRFCRDSCQEAFEAEPGKYAVKEAEAAGGAASAL